MHPSFKEMMNEVVACGSCCDCGAQMGIPLGEIRQFNDFETSMKVFLRLTRKQRERVPVPPGRTDAWVRPAGFGAR